jgi:hypothetical protein
MFLHRTEKIPKDRNITYGVVCNCKPHKKEKEFVRLAAGGDRLDYVKLPQPQLRTRTYTQTGQSTLRATQIRAALSNAYAVTYQNRITDKP